MDWLVTIAGLLALLVIALRAFPSLFDSLICTEEELTGPKRHEGICPHCVTPWKCNGPHEPGA